MAIKTRGGKYRGTCDLCGYKTPIEEDKGLAEYALSRHEQSQHGGNKETGARGSSPMKTKAGSRSVSIGNNSGNRVVGSGNYKIIKTVNGKRTIYSRNLPGDVANERARTFNKSNTKPGVIYHVETMKAQDYK